MKRLLFALAAIAAAAMGADDPWTAVMKLQSGQEIRVIKKSTMHTAPVLGTFDEATDERLVLVVKNEQIAIAKDQIDRVDARPPKTGSRVKVEGKVTTTDPQAAAEPPAGMDSKPNVPGTTSTGGVSIGNKPDYATVYRRPLGVPKK